MSIAQVVADVFFLILCFLLGNSACGWLNCAEQSLSSPHKMDSGVHNEEKEKDVRFTQGQRDLCPSTKAKNVHFLVR